MPMTMPMMTMPKGRKAVKQLGDDGDGHGDSNAAAAAGSSVVSTRRCERKADANRKNNPSEFQGERSTDARIIEVGRPPRACVFGQRID